MRSVVVFWKAKGMILFLLIYYGLLGWISNRMFVGTSWSTLHFASRESGIWSMMEVFAGANMLVKALPSFSSNRIIGIILFMFNLLGVAFFVMLMRAILYHVYKAEVSERVQNFKSTVDKTLAKIFDKFKSENEETLSYPEALQAIKHVIKEHTRGEFKKISLDNVISIMDRANLGRIDRERFYE